MITLGLIGLAYHICNLFFNLIEIPSLHLENFDTYIAWFSTQVNYAFDILVLLIPKEVFITAIGAFFIIHNLEFFLMLMNFAISKIPIIGTSFRNS